MTDTFSPELEELLADWASRVVDRAFDDHIAKLEEIVAQLGDASIAEAFAALKIRLGEIDGLDESQRQRTGSELRNFVETVHAEKPEGVKSILELRRDLAKDE